MITKGKGVYDDPAIERLYSVPAAKEYSRDMGKREGK